MSTSSILLLGCVLSSEPPCTMLAPDLSDCSCTCCTRVKAYRGHKAIGGACSDIYKRRPSTSCKVFVKSGKRAKLVALATSITLLNHSKTAMRSAIHLCSCITECNLKVMVTKAKVPKVVTVKHNIRPNICRHPSMLQHSSRSSHFPPYSLHLERMSCNCHQQAHTTYHTLGHTQLLVQLSC